MSMKLIQDIIAITARNEQLEREADWLATHLANALIDPGLIDCLHSLAPGLGHPPTPEMLREAAHSAVTEQQEGAK